MLEHMIKPDAFWNELEHNVRIWITAALEIDQELREPRVLRLRGYEKIARSTTDRRQTIQILASGRRLLGDRKHLAQPSDLVAPRLKTEAKAVCSRA